MKETAQSRDDLDSGFGCERLDRLNHSPVYVKAAAGDKRRSVRSEKRHRPRDFAGCTEALQRDRRNSIRYSELLTLLTSDFTGGGLLDGGTSFVSPAAPEA